MPMIKVMLCILYKNCILFIIHLQIHADIHVNRLEDNTCYLFEEQIQELLSS